MNPANFAIKRPVTIVAAFFLIIIAGILAYQRMSVDMFPDVTFPIVTVSSIYTGTSPEEMERLISQPIERELSDISGIKSITSINNEGMSLVIIEFNLGTDIRFAEQKVKDKISALEPDLPNELDRINVRDFDPTLQDIVSFAVFADLSVADLYDLVDEEIVPMLEQVNQVGSIEVFGGRQREYKVILDRIKMRNYRISASQVAAALTRAGKNVPVGTLDDPKRELTIKTIGEFDNIDDVKNTVISFYGNENTVKLSDIATVKESLKKVKNLSYVDGSPSLRLKVYKQSDANTIAVADAVKERVAEINAQYKNSVPGFKVELVRDGTYAIRANVTDVFETIIIGIILVIIVVLFFLGSFRSTMITAVAIPNSLIGAFMFMQLFDFSINLLTLLAMSLSIGLLIDDAIVVRENIFRHIEMGKSALRASVEGTKEIMNAVIGVSLTVLAVFAPVAFIDGIVGQFFQEFGLTVCFIIIISTMDALLVAPMLSTFFAKKGEGKRSLYNPLNWLLNGFDKFYALVAASYEKLLGFVISFRIISLLFAFAITFGAVAVLKYGNITFTFIPTPDNGEFDIQLELPAGTPLEVMNARTLAFDEKIRSLPQVNKTAVDIGDYAGATNKSVIYVQLVPSEQRTHTTSQVREILRDKFFDQNRDMRPRIIESGQAAAGMQPFNFLLMGNNLDDLITASADVYEYLDKSGNLKDLNTNIKEGRPELSVVVNAEKAHAYGISNTIIGGELRAQIEGVTPAVIRKNNIEYDVRVMLDEDKNNLKDNFNQLLIPNINGRLIRLKDVASLRESIGPATIYRKDRARYVGISGSVNPEGRGMGAAIEGVINAIESGEIKLPQGVRYKLEGEAENFRELGENMLIAVVLALILVYLILASLYESFVVPITIMLVIPLSTGGAIYALAITSSSLDIFSTIGCIMLMAVATKNSIIMLDYIGQKIETGMEQKEAIIEASVIRLRPILMTSLALIAGMMPVAIGLNEASSQRTSMGIAVIGGVITSTLLTLLVIPAVYTYMRNLEQLIGKIAFLVMVRPNEKEMKALKRDTDDSINFDDV